MQTDDDYGIYRRPSSATLVAVVCAGAALFFGAWSMQLKKNLTAELLAAQADALQAKKGLEDKERAVDALNGQVRSLQNDVGALRLRLEMAEGRPVAPVAAPAALPATATTNDAAPAPRAPRAPTAPRPATAAAPAASAKPLSAAPLPAAAPAPAAAQTVQAAPAANEVSANANNNGATLEAADALAGEILTYNPDSQRVYLSLGSANGGVRQGNRFSVWRGDEYVTDIEVLKVFSVTSTCKVAGDAAGIQVGDVARRARPALGAL